MANLVGCHSALRIKFASVLLGAISIVRKTSIPTVALAASARFNSIRVSETLFQNLSYLSAVPNERLVRSQNGDDHT